VFSRKVALFDLAGNLSGRANESQRKIMHE